MDDTTMRSGQALRAFTLDMLLKPPMVLPGREHEAARAYQDTAAVSHPEVSAVLKEAALRLLEG